MARTNLLDTRTINYLELIENGRLYRVPPYQRDYSWTMEQWEDLYNDIVELQLNPENRHYMGALVVEGERDREFLIIDGQQRLATLSLFALAVIDRLQTMAKDQIDPDANKERSKELRNRFIGEKDPASLIEKSRLYLNEIDNAFYQDYLIQLKKPLNPRKLPRSSQLLWRCFQYFQKQLNQLSEFSTDGRAVASLLYETVARQILFILITVDNELNAYMVFETLNARGQRLTTTDLLKNYLFSRVQVGTDLEALPRRWESLIKTVGQSRFPEFLRYHLLCKHAKVRSQRLFKIVQDHTRTAEDVFCPLSGFSCDPETDPGTIEYILPEHPGEIWSETYPPQQWEDTVYRIGNLTLLEASNNWTVGNKEYVEKCASYRNSKYTLTRNISEMAPEQWTPELVRLRQAKLASRAVQVWRSDFA